MPSTIVPPRMTRSCIAGSLPWRCHRTGKASAADLDLRPGSRSSAAEGVGFEPTVPIGHNGFRDRPIRPLSHPSRSHVTGQRAGCGDNAVRIRDRRAGVLNDCSCGRRPADRRPSTGGRTFGGEPHGNPRKGQWPARGWDRRLLGWRVWLWAMSATAEAGAEVGGGRRSWFSGRSADGDAGRSVASVHSWVANSLPPRRGLSRRWGGGERDCASDAVPTPRSARRNRSAHRPLKRAFGVGMR